jgi:cysteine desulfurase
MKCEVYLDNSTIARPSDKAISAMMPFFTDRWGSPSAPHQKGQELYPALKECYQALYGLVGAKEEDSIIFTSSGAEAVNHVIYSVYHDVTLATGKNQFITTALEEAPLTFATGRLEQLHCTVKTVRPNKEGLITAAAVADMISPRTALLSLSWGNGLTGVIQPVTAIAELCRKRGILLHLDATHILGKLFYELAEIAPDFLTFNGDQLHAPKGTGGLYIKAGLKCSPFIVGGSEQGGLRAGTVNMPALAAFAQAAKEAVDGRDLLCTEVARLRDRLEREVEAMVPGAFPLFREQERLPHCTTIAFPGVANEALLFMLNRKGIFASIGGGVFQQLGLLLTACGIEESLAYSAVSFSLSRYTTDDDIDQAVKGIKQVVEHLRHLSKGWMS